MKNRIKKIFSLGLSVALGMSIVSTTSCNNAEEMVNIDSRYKIVYSGDVDCYEVILISQFKEQIEDRFKVKIDMVSDSIEQGEYEILIGYTNRSGSASLYESFKENKGNNGFAVKTSGTEIYLLGSDLTQTYLALDYALKNVFVNDSEGDITFSQTRMEYVSDGKDIVFDLQELKRMGRGVQFVAEELCVYIPIIGAHTVMQGAGTDGTYAYFACIDKTDSVEEGVIYKYRMSDWTLIATSKSLPIGHANDITYDAKNHRLLIPTLGRGASGRSGLAIVDPDSLELIEEKYLGVGSWKIQYLPSTGGYIADGNPIKVLDSNFNVITTISEPYREATHQNVWTDEKYIYDLRFTAWSYVEIPGYVAIYDFNGNDLGYVPLRGLGRCEPEGIFGVDDNFYLATGVSYIAAGLSMCNVCYKIELIPEIWW